MSVLAYCKTCDRLVVVVPKGYKFDGSRERWYHPIDHDDAAGKPCLGVKRGI